MTVDPEKLWAVVEKHASTVTLNFLCDLMPVVGMRLTVKRIAAQGIEAATAAETVELGSVHESPVGSADAPK
jgi:hypothetical protein